MHIRETPGGLQDAPVWHKMLAAEILVYTWGPGYYTGPGRNINPPVAPGRVFDLKCKSSGRGRRCAHVDCCGPRRGTPGAVLGASGRLLPNSFPPHLPRSNNQDPTGHENKGLMVFVFFFKWGLGWLFVWRSSCVFTGLRPFRRGV